MWENCNPSEKSMESESVADLQVHLEMDVGKEMLKGKQTIVFLLPVVEFPWVTETSDHLPCIIPSK